MMHLRRSCCNNIVCGARGADYTRKSRGKEVLAAHKVEDTVTHCDVKDTLAHGGAKDSVAHQCCGAHAEPARVVVGTYATHHLEADSCRAAQSVQRRQQRRSCAIRA
ncbi:MAG: hypothetical protein ACK53Y_07005 [bacterium]